jgi:CDP-glycerol glycerophosphotransferase (TagB/SpsB family)
LVTQRPQILYFPDMQRYEETRGLLLHPLEDFAPGPVVRTFPDLLAQLDAWISGEDPWQARRAQLRDLMIPASTQCAADSLLAVLEIHGAAATKPALSAKPAGAERRILP